MFKRPPAWAMTISYSYSSMAPLSLPKTLKPLTLERGSKSFLTAFWIILLSFSNAVWRFVAFYENCQKMKTSSSVFKWILFLSFWTLLMIYLANPLTLNYSFCLVSNKTMTLSPPIAWYSWMFSSTNFSLMIMSS